MAEDFFTQPTLPGIPEPEEKKIVETPQIPQTIGPYKIESLLERGGMSLLYLGSLPDSNESTTIKVISPKYASNPEILQRFLNEAEIISMTNHPNIVKLYGHGKWEGGVYIAMEFIHGVTLRQYILQHKISLRYALEIIIHIAYALIHLHTHGVIHRDLKPENILVTDKSEIKVIDFGIAQLLTERLIVGTPQRPRLIGTPVYMSPEQKENPENVSYPSDIYSLGIIAYELILGKLSHGRIQLSLMPEEIQKILTKALQPRPENRYQDVVDFVADISTFMKTLEEDHAIPTLEKAKHVNEELKNAQLALISTLPSWSGINIGLAYDLAEIPKGIICDFFNFPDNKYGIITAEVSKTSIQSIINSATLQGMIRALVRSELTMEQTVIRLNELMIKEKINKLDTFNFLIISPESRSCEYFTCGNKSLWITTPEETTPKLLERKSAFLGEDISFVCESHSAEWESSATFLLATSSAVQTEESLIRTWGEIAPLSPEEQADSFLKKLRFNIKTPMSSFLFLVVRS